MSPTKRIQVRPVVVPSIVDIRFKKLFGESGKNLALKKMHPAIVTADLRRGCLDSLDRYLKQNGGIPDRYVALEVRKLISGSQSRSKFRLLVVAHPDRPKSVGGHPIKKGLALSADEQALLAQYDAVLEIEGKKILAKEVLAEKANVPKIRIERALRKRKVLNRKAQEALDFENRVTATIERRHSALTRLAAGKNGRKDYSFD